MKIRTIEYFVRETIDSFRHNGLMSIASVTTVALSLLILGMFLVLVLNLNNMLLPLNRKCRLRFICKTISLKNRCAIWVRRLRNCLV